MTTRTIIATLAAVLSTAPLTLGLPQTTNAVPNSQSVFWPWSSHPDCAAPVTACKADCTAAVNTLCRKDLGEDYIVETVGECTATYKYDLGNTLPAFEQCYSAFAYINDAGKPGPDGCGGTFGGALGWDNKGNRTRDPIYALYPSSGSGNCFKQPGQEKDAPLPRDMLPDGSRLPIEQCPSAVSRRDIGGTTGCTIGSSFYGFSCSAVCLAWVASLTAWWTFGAGVAAGILPCLGACTGASLGFDVACEKLAKNDKLKPRLLLDAAPPAGPCEGTQSVAIECPAIRTSLLAFHKCPGSEPDKPEEVATGEGGGEIHF